MLVKCSKWPENAKLTFLKKNFIVAHIKVRAALVFGHFSSKPCYDFIYAKQILLFFILSVYIHVYLPVCLNV